MHVLSLSTNGASINATLILLNYIEWTVQFNDTHISLNLKILAFGMLKLLA